jgi:branched-chain amino acid transport system permease protein
MIAYILAGLVLGGIYSISAAAMVVTYVSAGVLNFAFGSLAFFIARLYYYLHVESGWGIAPAAVVAIVLVGPMLGIVLYYALFKFLTQSSALTKVVATIGLSVAIPAVAQLLFGTSPILSTPGLAPRPVRTFHVAGTTVDMDQVISYACIASVLLIGWLILHRTRAGLLIRATVDSEALTSISGVTPGRVAVGVWAASTFLAGLAGVLAGPTLNVDSVTNYTLLTASAFAAVVAARLRSLVIAVLVGLLMGIAGSLIQWGLPPNSSWTSNLVSSIPFAIVVVFLLIYSRRGSFSGRTVAGGALDKSIHVEPSVAPARRARTTSEPGRRRLTFALNLVPNNLFLVVALVLPLLLHGYRISLVAEAAALATIFLSYTLLTGQGGMISLCQITFAGIGALTTAQLATVHGWPVLAALVAGAALAGVGGLIVGSLTVRMGNLYVALATLTFGLLMSTLVFHQARFYQLGSGVNVPRPSFIHSDRSLAYFMIAIFALIGLGIAAIRSSTLGLALSALRSSETGARAVGINVVRLKVTVSAAAAAIAGLGGGLLAMYAGAALPDSFDAFVGIVWFAVLVTNGVRTNNAAMAAGLLFTYLPDIFGVYAPLRYGPVPTALFGLGAILLARNPEGVISLNGRQLHGLWARFVSRSDRAAEAVVLTPESPVPTTVKV